MFLRLIISTLRITAVLVLSLFEGVESTEREASEARGARASRIYGKEVIKTENVCLHPLAPKNPSPLFPLSLKFDAGRQPLR
jgi:hypothetical protein